MSIIHWSTMILVALLCQSWISSVSAKPNIIFMLADDIGFNDFAFISTSTGIDATTTTDTSFIDSLAVEHGVIIDHYYVHSECSPSRAAFLSGRFSYRYNMQWLVNPSLALALSRQLSLVSEEFKVGGYETHMIGKWHVGYVAEEYTPTYRGFDTFFGYYNAGCDYYDTTYTYNSSPNSPDQRDGTQPFSVDQSDSPYSTWRYRDAAIRIIETAAASDSNTPYFMYLAWQASHTPAESPPAYYHLYDSIDDDGRAHMQAQTTALNDAIRDIVNVLYETDTWQNTVIVISSDNGAMYGAGDNYPLRGSKSSNYEGGIRVPGFITGGYLPASVRGTRFGSANYFVHQVDWYPTLLDIAGIEVSYAKSLTKVDDTVTLSWENDVSFTIPLDGTSFWPYLSGAQTLDTSTEREMTMDAFYYDDEDVVVMEGSTRRGAWKFLRGSGVKESSAEDNVEWDTSYAVDVSAANALGCDLTTSVTGSTCWNETTGCLYNIYLDPCEFTDLSKEYPDVRAQLDDTLSAMRHALPSSILTQESSLYLDDSVYQPASEDDFWGPALDISEVEFEHLLYADYVDLYATNEDEMKADVRAVIVALPTLAADWKTVVWIALMVSLFVISALLWFTQRSSNKQQLKAMTADECGTYYGSFS